MAKVKDEAQAQLFDRTIENPELEEAIEKMLELGEAAKEYAAARKPVKAITETLNLKDGERVRIGRYVITGRERSGGGFDVKSWTKTTIGSIAELTN